MDNSEAVGVFFKAKIDPYLSAQYIMLHKLKSMIRLYNHVPGRFTMSNMYCFVISWLMIF